MIFPKNVATEGSFCNRESERKRLRENFDQLQHTVVVSPRRYGKTSLILQALEEQGWPYAHVDFFLAMEDQKIEDRFFRGSCQTRVSAHVS